MPAPHSLQIRPLAPTERAVWTDLWTGYLTFYETILPQEVYASTFARLTDPAGDLRGHLAWDGTHALGLVHHFLHPTCWKVGPVCYLQDLFTLPEARGRGVARALIERVYAEADAAGAPDVYWTTAENNYAGRMLYDRIGQRTPFIKYRRAI